ncbi:hypothetical protein [Streptomyces sp. NPDC086766]|uniref:hypothetical protein n=1 Tax=Streptomyces sp. NPDC086766 TaxID=3365754 RepID=UPI00382DDECA
MTAQEHEDGMRPEPTLSAAEKAEGFAAVMKRLKSHSPDERARLQTQADEVVLGHEAYALGQEYLDRRDYEAARRWLRVAASHHIPGAAQVLDEIGARQTLDEFADLTAFSGDHAATDAASCGTIPSPAAVRAADGNQRSKGDQTWASAMEGLSARMTAAARAQAGQILAQARRDADAILAEARTQAEKTAAACAEMVLDTEKDRRKAAKLLAAARQEAESVRSEIAETAERARRGARDILAKEQRQALQLILEHAQREAAQIRSRARRQGGVPNSTGNKARERLFRKYWRASLAERAIKPEEYLVSSLWDVLNGPTRLAALERLPQALFSLHAAFVLTADEISSVIRRSVWVQEGNEQDDAGPKNRGDVWQVLNVGAGMCDAASSEVADYACRGRSGATDQGGPGVPVIGVPAECCEDGDDDSELGVEGVGNSAGR